MFYLQFIDYTYCDEIQRLEGGNQTNWGCQAARSQIDCETIDWWKQCCLWKDGKCCSREEGANSVI